MEENDKLKKSIISKIAVSKFKEENTAIKNNKIHIVESVAVACFCIALSTGVVFAKEIENYFKNFFSISNKAIVAAVENDYVQKEEMNLIYDNGIGIKLENLILDNLNLNISFIFETEKKDIKYIRLDNFTMTNDNEKVIYRSEFKYEQSMDDVPLYSSFSLSNNPVKLNEKTFADSILIGLREGTEEFKEIYFDIKSVNIIYADNTTETINGNWNFKVTIDEEMKKNVTINYELKEENEYIESATATLSPTGMIVELNLKEKLAREYRDLLYMYVIECNGKTYTPTTIERSEIYIKLIYTDIGFFIEDVKDIEKFNLYIEYYDNTFSFHKKMEQKDK